MGTVTNVILLLVGLAIAWVASMPLNQIRIIIHCAFPIINMLKSDCGNDLFDLNACKKFFNKSLCINIFIYVLVVTLVVIFAPRWMQYGFLGETAFMFLITIGAMGHRNFSNRKESYEILSRYYKQQNEKSLDESMLIVELLYKAKMSSGEMPKPLLGLVDAFAITAVMWLISRVIPGLVTITSPESFALKYCISLLMLPAGWVVAERISKSRSSRWVKWNLYIFIILESLGIMTAVSYLIGGFGRIYSIDPYGIPYSSYPTIYGGTIILEIIYIVLCGYLAKKTGKEKRDSSAAKKGIEIISPKVFWSVALLLVLCIVGVAIGLSAKGNSTPIKARTEAASNALISETEALTYSEEISVEEWADAISEILSENLTENVELSVFYTDTSEKRDITVKMWIDGAYAVAEAAVGGDNEAIEIWELLTDEVITLSSEFYNVIQEYDKTVSINVIYSDGEKTWKNMICATNGEVSFNYVGNH